MLRKKITNMSTKEKKEFAEAIGVDVKSVHHWGSGRNLPSRKRIPLIAGYFGWDEKGLEASLIPQQGETPNENQEDMTKSNIHNLFAERGYQPSDRRIVDIMNGVIELNELEPDLLNYLLFKIQDLLEQRRIVKKNSTPQHENTRKKPKERKKKGGVNRLNHNINKIGRLTPIFRPHGWTAIICTRDRIHQMLRPKNPPGPLAKTPTDKFRSEFEKMVDMNTMHLLFDQCDKTPGITWGCTTRLMQEPHGHVLYEIMIKKQGGLYYLWVKTVSDINEHAVKTSQFN
jgi:hypothetical protein